MRYNIKNRFEQDLIKNSNKLSKLSFNLIK